MTVEIRIDETLANRVRMGVLALEGVVVRPSDARLEGEVSRQCAGVRERFGASRSAQVPGVAEARSLYKAVGLDPTKTRPSNEALLRRALKGQPLYTINTLVDALNLCSLREQLPFGLYDRDEIVPPLTLRRGRPGEGYEGIRKGLVNVEGRPVLADAGGPFGNPTSDSSRSMIRPETRRALVVCYAPASCPPDRMNGVLDRTRETLISFSGGTEIDRRVL